MIRAYGCCSVCGFYYRQGILNKISMTCVYTTDGLLKIKGSRTLVGIIVISLILKP